MKLIWEITPSDVERVRQFVATHQSNPFVQHRIRRNLGDARPVITPGAFWKVLVGCLLTTQQRSGPDSAVARFMRLRPFPLAYTRCKVETDVADYVFRTLGDFGGIRRAQTIGSQLAISLRTLDGGLWEDVLPRLERLRTNPSPPEELTAAEFLAESIVGLGPKQSRNLLQILGLTRHEVPIDSRLTKWLNQFGFPLQLSAPGLSDPDYYKFVSKGVQELCKAATVYPCLLDAAVFASFDGARWRSDNLESWSSDD